MAIPPGDTAPDFELRDQTGQPVRLSDFHGKRAVVLVFYPLTFTRVCGAELCSVRDELGIFQNDDVATLAIACDTSPVLRAWADQQGFDFPLLSDFWPHGEVSRAYGVFNETLGIPDRGTFVIDREGRIVFSEQLTIGEQRDHTAWVAALDEIGAVAQ